MTEPLPGLPRKPVDRRLARTSLAAAQAVHQASLFCADDSEVAEALARGLAAHMLQIGDSTIPYEAKREALHEILDDVFTQSVKLYEENK